MAEEDSPPVPSLLGPSLLPGAAAFKATCSLESPSQAGRSGTLGKLLSKGLSSEAHQAEWLPEQTMRLRAASQGDATVPALQQEGAAGRSPVQWGLRGDRCSGYLRPKAGLGTGLEVTHFGLQGGTSGIVSPDTLV